MPTIIAFDRAQTTLSLAKAMAILDVVGLLAEPAPGDAQDAFVAAAEARWTALVAPLAPDAPARLAHGHYVYDCHIAGATAASPTALLAALRRAAEHKYTGWSPFRVAGRPAIAPYAVDDGVECWLGRPDAERVFDDASSSDFWRAGLDGRLYLRRGLEEDSVDALAPATVFDLTLPVWRAGEVLLHAHHLAAALGAGEAAEIRVRVRYAGLAGRELKSWANPHRPIFDDHRARTDSATGAVACPAGEIAVRLPALVGTLLAPLYERFDFFALPAGLIAEELARLMKARPAAR